MSKPPEPFSTSMSLISTSTIDQYRLMVESVREYAIYTTDPGGLITSWNDGATQIFGYHASETIGQPRDMLFPPDVVASGHVRREMERAASEGRASEDQWRLRKDGTRFWANGVLSALHDDTGRLLGFAKVVRDLTEQKRAEEALRNSQVLHRIAGRAARLGGCTFDVAARHLTWSDEVCAIYERPAGYQPTLHEALSHFPDEWRTQITIAFETCITDGIAYDLELELLSATGRRLWVRAIGEAVRDAAGEIVGVQGAFQDVSEQKRNELEQRQLAERLTTTFESITDGFFILDRDWRFTYVNPEAERMILRKRSELIGVTIWDAFPEAVGSAFEVAYRRAREDRCTVTIEEHFPPLGKTFHVRAYPSGQGLAIYFLDVTAHRAGEQALRLRDRAIQSVSQGILITDPRQPGNPIIYANAGVEAMTGYAADELIGRSPRMLHGQGTDADAARQLREAVAAGRSTAVELLHYRKGGDEYWCATSISPVHDDDGALQYFVEVHTDVTARRHLEAQLRQSQKMEAVGLLAGGVAHDFNNLLTVMSGHTELLLANAGLDADTRASLEAIRAAGDRAAALTRQLLGYSRQTMLQPSIVNVNEVVGETAAMLHRLIGEDIRFSTVLTPEISRIRIDRSQLDQILMNLAINARDAMPRGGSLTIETREVVLGDEYAATHLDCKPGRHVMLAITDSGSGMTADVKARIFEPFFTTKPVGHGTGLGLSMVFGIVQQSEGCIHVYSEPGIGTTFKLYFPALTDSALPAANAKPSATRQSRGSETILLVEDDDDVRNLAAHALTRHGYTVLRAPDGSQALELMQSYEGSLGLILTDVVMPSLSGPALTATLRGRFPDVKVLFMSGYTNDAVVRHGLLSAEVSFIQKPYTPLVLVRKVREVLDGVA